MNKITAIKSLQNGSEFAMWAFINIWSKFVNYWNIVKPKDNVAKQILEML